MKCPGAADPSCSAFSFLEILVTGGSCHGTASADCEVCSGGGKAVCVVLWWRGWRGWLSVWSFVSQAVTSSQNDFKLTFEEWFSEPDALCESGKAEAAARSVATAIAEVWSNAASKVVCDGMGYACGWSISNGNTYALAFAEAVAQAAAEAGAGGVADAFCFADVRAVSTVLASAAAQAQSDVCTTGGSAEDFQESYVSAVQVAIADAFASATAGACASGEGNERSSAVARVPLPCLCCWGRFRFRLRLVCLLPAHPCRGPVKDCSKVRDGWDVLPRDDSDPGFLFFPTDPGQVTADSKCTGTAESSQEGDVFTYGDVCGGVDQIKACTGAMSEACCAPDFNRFLCSCRNCNGPWIKRSRNGDAKKTFESRKGDKCFCVDKQGTRPPLSPPIGVFLPQCNGLPFSRSLALACDADDTVAQKAEEPEVVEEAQQPEPLVVAASEPALVEESEEESQAEEEEQAASGSHVVFEGSASGITEGLAVAAAAAQAPVAESEGLEEQSAPQSEIAPEAEGAPQPSPSPAPLVEETPEVQPSPAPKEPAHSATSPKGDEGQVLGEEATLVCPGAVDTSCSAFASLDILATAGRCTGTAGADCEVSSI